jgi:hypothetical protein
MPLQPNETRLAGEWKLVGNEMIADSICDRIHQLVATELEEIAADDSGWMILYRDPSDGRYWELSYPQSEMHGGGPPVLAFIPYEEARARYDLPDK